MLLTFPSDQISVNNTKAIEQVQLMLLPDRYRPKDVTHT